MYGLTKSHLPCDTCHTLPTVPVIPLTCNFQYPYPCVITYSSQMSPLLKWKPICPLAYVKGKTSSSHFLKICFCKGAATFLNPFKIGAAAFLAFYWYRCGCFLRGKLALAKGQPLFWDPFKIQPAMFLEINISKGQLLFLDPFEIELAMFLEITLVKGQLLFWDPFEIEAATFFEISISNCVFHIWTSITSYYGLKWKQI